MYPQNNFQQQNMLPFSCTQLNSQPMQFTHGQPPFVLQLQCPAHIAGYLPYIATSILNSISINAQNSAPRIFVYNQISNNGYQNNEYIQLVATAIDLISLSLMKGVYRSVEDSLNDIGEKVAAIAATQAVMMYPSIMQYMPPDQQTAVHQQMQMLQGLTNEILAMKNGGNQFRQPMPMNNGFQQPMNQNQFGMGGGANMTRPIANGFAGSFGGNAPFVTSPNNQVFNDDTGRKYNYNKEPEVVQPTQPRHKPVPLESVTTTIEVKPKVEEWKPTVSQPYPLAVNTSPNGLSFNSNSAQGNDMDRSQHTIVDTTAKQKIVDIVPVGVATREQAFNKSVAELTSQVNQTQAMFKLGDIEQTYNAHPIIDNFLESAIFKTRMAQRLLNKDQSCSVFQQTVYIETPIFAPESFALFATETLQQAASFNQVATLLKERLNNSKLSDNEATVIMQIDKTLTKEINLILANNLSIPEVSIESFIDDIDSLPGYLEKSKGLSYRKALENIEGDFLVQNVNFAPIMETNEWFNNSYREVIEGVEVNNNEYCGVIIRNVPHLIVVAEIIEEDLNLELTARASAHAVQSKDFPALHKLISTNVSNNQAAHYYLMTSDNVLFEMHKGLLGKDFYLISKVN